MFLDVQLLCWLSVQEEMFLTCSNCKSHLSIRHNIFFVDCLYRSVSTCSTWGPACSPDSLFLLLPPPFQTPPSPYDSPYFVFLHSFLLPSYTPTLTFVVCSTLPTLALQLLFEYSHDMFYITIDIIHVKKSQYILLLNEIFTCNDIVFSK